MDEQKLNALKEEAKRAIMSMSEKEFAIFLELVKKSDLLDLTKGEKQ